MGSWKAEDSIFSHLDSKKLCPAQLLSPDDSRVLQGGATDEVPFSDKLPENARDAGPSL